MPRRILALDIGTKRTGVALAELPSGFVVALETIEASSDINLANAVRTLVQKHGVSDIVVGLPLLLSGEEGSQAKKVQACADLLREQLKLPITFIDERLTSIGAKKGNSDAKAACEILEGYLAKTGDKK